MTTYRLYLRDQQLQRVAEIDDYQSATLTLRFNAPGIFELVVPADGPIAALATFGYGLVVVRALPGAAPLTVFSGSIRGFERRRDARNNTLTLTGADDTARLGFRLALPVASGPPYTAQATDTRTGPAETVLKGFVNDNAGPNAPAARRLTGLTIAPDTALGASVTRSARFDNLVQLLIDTALQGGGLGFRVAQVDTSLQFQVYQPVDRTQSAIFSFGRGNLRDYDYLSASPDANYVIVGGAGEGTARTFVEGGDSASIVFYGERIEDFVDERSVSGTTELAQRRDKELAEKASKTSLKVTPIDTAGLAFGRDYFLGDQVTVEVEGVTIRDIVREVRLQLQPDGETVGATVGTPAHLSLVALFGTLRTLRNRVGKLERR